MPLIATLELESKKFSYNAVVSTSSEKIVLKFLKNNQIFKVFFIVDKNLRKKFIKMRKIISEDIQVSEVFIEASEEGKDLRKIFNIYAKMLAEKCDRHTVLIALGGGVTGDISGFIAGTYMRGIPWIGVPTTLLAMVDSSVGGKTGVNHPLGKNLIGLINQPSLVINDPGFLKTFSDRDLVSGFGEMVKIALTLDLGFYTWLNLHWKKILSLKQPFLSDSLMKSIKLKMSIVKRDPFEKRGIRDILNFGHTIGHALETITSYKQYRHGEAVIWGMRVEAALSVVRGHLSSTEYVKIQKFLFEIPCPPLVRLNMPLFLKVMSRDKKSHGGKIRFVLLKRVGKTILDAEVTREDLAEAFSLVKVFAKEIS